ncbi:MAG TPA: NUDIX hydrolase [Aeromicrobium sp.]|nr:NUDIX hydrolase [Aeromicrobium sp.]
MSQAELAAHQIGQRVDLAVSTVIFALRPHPKTGELTLWLPLVRRIRQPYEGRWALPGGPLAPEHDLVTSARQTLESTVSISETYLEQLYSFGAVDRGGSDRTVSVVYWALVPRDREPAVVDGVEWFVADEVPELAFDHNAIVDYALDRLRAKITYSPIALAFVGAEFTLADLRTVHEAVLRKPLDPANFRRQVLASGTVVPTGTHLQGASHRPPALYRAAVPLTTKEPR